MSNPHIMHEADHSGDDSSDIGSQDTAGQQTPNSMMDDGSTHSQETEASPKRRRSEDNEEEEQDENMEINHPQSMPVDEEPMDMDFEHSEHSSSSDYLDPSILVDESTDDPIVATFLHLGRLGNGDGRLVNMSDMETVLKHLIVGANKTIANLGTRGNQNHKLFLATHLRSEFGPFPSNTPDSELWISARQMTTSIGAYLTTVLGASVTDGMGHHLVRQASDFMARYDYLDKLDAVHLIFQDPENKGTLTPDERAKLGLPVSANDGSMLDNPFAENPGLGQAVENASQEPGNKPQCSDATLIQHFLNEIKAKGWTRREGRVYQPIKVEDDDGRTFWTRACEPVGKDGDMNKAIRSLCGPEHNQELYLLTKPLTNKMKMLVDQIESHENSLDTFFPESEVCRSAFSARDGVYLCKHKRFVPHSDWEAVSAELGLSPRLVTANYFDQKMGHFAHATNYLDVETPTLQRVSYYQNIRDEPEFQQYVHNPRSYEPSEDVVERCLWWCGLVGRMLYDVGELDNWQAVVWFTGFSSTGKSCMIKMLENFYQAEDTFNLAENIEKKFGIAKCFGKFVAVAPDIGEDFELNHKNFLSMSSGDTVSAAVKHGDPITSRWTTPLAFASNEARVRGWSDSQLQTTRRTIFLWFLRAVQAEHIDGNIERDLLREIPRIIVKCNLAYHQLLDKAEQMGESSASNSTPFPRLCDLNDGIEGLSSHNAVSYTSILCKGIKDDIAYLSKFGCPVRHMLTCTDYVVKDPEGTCTLSDFRFRLAKFCSDNNHNRVHFEPELYKKVLDDFGVTITLQQDPEDSRRMLTIFQGIRCIQSSGE